MLALNSTPAPDGGLTAREPKTPSPNPSSSDTRTCNRMSFTRLTDKRFAVSRPSVGDIYVTFRDGPSCPQPLPSAPTHVLPACPPDALHNQLHPLAAAWCAHLQAHLSEACSA